MKRKICTVISLLIMGVVCFTVIAQGLTNVFTGKSLDPVVLYDGSEDYPYENKQDKVVTDDNEETKKSSVFSKIISYTQILTTREYVYKMPFVLTKKSFDKITGIDMTTSHSNTSITRTVVDIGDGYLSNIVDDFSPEDVEKIIEFGKQTEANDMNFLLVMTPFKIDKTTQFKSGIYKNYSDEYEDEYIKMVKDSGLHVLSMSEAIRESGIDRQSLFFKTDHHWLPQTGLWADKIMCEYLNENMGFSIDTDIFSEENYDITYLDEKWLGAQGRTVTAVYAEPEPFPVIIPKYDTDVTAFVSYTNETVSGPIDKTLYNWSALENPDIHERNNYNLYSYGDIALLSIHNNMVNNGRRVLIIKRSFADTMVPFFASTVENLDVIDLRVFKGSLQSFIKKNKPDTIIVIYGIAEIVGTGTYDFS